MLNLRKLYSYQYICCQKYLKHNVQSAQQNYIVSCNLLDNIFILADFFIIKISICFFIVFRFTSVDTYNSNTIITVINFTIFHIIIQDIFFMFTQKLKTD